MAAVLLNSFDMRRGTGFATVLVLLTSFSAWGQNRITKSDRPAQYRFGLSVHAVHLAATVVNDKGRLVTDLQQDDFIVYENGVPQEVTYFARGTDSPVDVMLLVDASGSMDMIAKVANARNAAIQLVSILGHEDRVAVYGFDSEIFQLCPFTEDKDAAVDALRRLEPFGATAIRDAVAGVSDVIRGQGFGRRAIVLITDGIDTASELTVDQAVEIAKGVDLPVYIIRVLSPIDDPKSDAFVGVHGRDADDGKALERFAMETGGQLYGASQLGALRLASLKVREELKTQYRLAYVPRNNRRDGSFRRIEIFVRQKNVEVRSRKGYYARKPEASIQTMPAVSINYSR